MLTAERARQLLSYDPDTGILRWKETLSRRRKQGEIAGWIEADGRVGIFLEGTKCRAHQVIWLIVHSYWPDEIDHIDRDHGNNRLANLREADRSTNNMNRGGNKTGTSRFKGVYWASNRERWHVQIKKEGETTFLGYFTDEVEAAKAYDAAAERLFGPFACTNKSLGWISE